MDGVREDSEGESYTSAIVMDLVLADSLQARMLFLFFALYLYFCSGAGHNVTAIATALSGMPFKCTLSSTKCILICMGIDNILQF